MEYKIERAGFFFHAVNTKTGWKSSPLTSASQAGMIIQRRAGKEAHRIAAETFLKGI